MDWQSTWSCKHCMFLENKCPWVELVVNEPGNLYCCALSLGRKCQCSVHYIFHDFPSTGRIAPQSYSYESWKKSFSIFLVDALQVLESCCEVAQSSVQLDLEDSWSGQPVPVSYGPHHEKKILLYVQSKPTLFGLKRLSLLLHCRPRQKVSVCLTGFICLWSLFGERNIFLLMARIVHW